MSLITSIEQALTPVVIEAGFFLEEVTLTSAGNRRLVTCVVDGEKSLNMDDVTSISREISNLLEEAPFMGETAFTLEVTSPGVDRPLTLPRHWRKNATRLVRVTTSDENVVTLVIEAKVLKEVSVAFVDVKKAIVEIEFNRKGDGA